LTRSSRRVSAATVFFALLSLLLGVLLYWKTRPEPAGQAPERRAARREPAGKRPRAATPKASVSPPEPRSSSGPVPRIAIILDDLGGDLAAVRRIAKLSRPVAGAVLPGLAGSARAARELAEAGQEVLLHLPMEPEGFPRVRPGPGVIVRAQSDEEITETLSEDLESVPGAVGVNNHMGSAATADPRVMRAVLKELAGRGLFFVDSRTTEETVAREVARELKVPCASRGVFLDSVATEEAVAASFQELLRRAKREGSAVALGHPYPATLALLERELPDLAEKGVKLVRVSELVDKNP